MSFLCRQHLLIMFVASILPILVLANDKDIFPTEYFNYSNGLARIRMSDKYGFIDKNRKIVVIPQYTYAHDFSDGMARIQMNNTKYLYIDKSGNIVFQPQFDAVYNFSNGLARIEQNGKYGYIDKSGNIVVQPQFYGAYDFVDDMARIMDNKKYGYIDKKGIIVIQPQFGVAFDFSEGLARIEQNGKYGFIDKNGKIVIKPQYTFAFDFSDGMARIQVNGKYGFIDKNGKIIINPQFSNINDFSDGMARVQVNGKYGFIDKSGKIVIKPRFSYAHDFVDGMARILDNNKYGYIDKNGNVVIQPQFNEAFNFSDGFALVKLNGIQGYIDKNGKIGNTNIMTLEQFLQTNLTPLSSVAEYIKPRIENDINIWQKKGEFESTSKWQERVNENTRINKISELTDKYKSEYAVLLANYKEEYKSLCNQYYVAIEKQKKLGFNTNQLQLSAYDADNESFMISSNGAFADILLPVPTEDAPSFKQNWETIKHTADLHYIPNGDDVALTSITFTNGNKKYTYDGSISVKYTITDVDYNFKPIELALNENDNIDYSFDPLETFGNSIVQVTTQNLDGNKAKVERRKMSIGDLSDVDMDIPISVEPNTNTFAVIIGNENYQKVSKVQFAQNDAETFATYCKKTLGLPEKNVRNYKDATYATILSAVRDIQGIAKAYKGDLNVIFYYAGHGIPNESSGDAFLLPVDVDGRQTEVCYPLNRLYSELGSMEARSVMVFMDACFSGSERGNNMLASARGVAIKAKASAPSGKMIVFSAASGDETAYPYQEKGHGLFTYFLLKKLQETKGDVSLFELGSYIVDNVAKESIVSNGKSQTPTITPSQSVADTWKNMTLK